MNTFKKTVVGFVIVLVGFAATGCASTGYLGPRPFEGPLGEVVAGNLALTCPGDYFVGPPVNRCLRHLANIGPHIAGYPMYVGSRGGRQLSRAEKIVLVGAGSAAVGGLITKDWRGAVVAGTAGAITTAVLTRGRNNDQPVVIHEGQQVRVGADGVPVAVGRPVVSAAQESYRPVGNSIPSGPKWYIRNMTGGRGELWNGGLLLKVLEPGESYAVSNPSGVRLVILVPTEQGTLEPREAVRKPRRDGWDMVVPSVQ